MQYKLNSLEIIIRKKLEAQIEKAHIRGDGTKRFYSNDNEQQQCILQRIENT